MNKKKVTKVALVSTLATAAFVAATPADASAVTPQESVKNAQLEANKLIPHYNLVSKGKFEATAAFEKQYSVTLQAIEEAKKAIGPVKGAERVWLNDQLRYADVQRVRAARIIDAGKHIQPLNVAVENFQQYLGHEVTADTVEAYDALSSEIKNAERAISRIYGPENRAIAGNDLVQPAKLIREQLMWEISVYNLVNEIDGLLEAGKVEEAEAKFAELDRVKERAVAFKEKGQALYPGFYERYVQVDAQLEAKEEAAKAVFAELTDEPVEEEPVEEEPVEEEPVEEEPVEEEPVEEEPVEEEPVEEEPVEEEPVEEEPVEEEPVEEEPVEEEPVEEEPVVIDGGLEVIDFDHTSITVTGWAENTDTVELELVSDELIVELGTVAVEVDGSFESAYTFDEELPAGSYDVNLYVDGELLDSTTLVLEEVEPPAPEFVALGKAAEIGIVADAFVVRVVTVSLDTVGDASEVKLVLESGEELEFAFNADDYNGDGGYRLTTSNMAHTVAVLGAGTIYAK
ncbi:hypothetical protein [Alkalihalobacillus deserti]|uniref:hypothetical protein n=1 Tax=Alkalihalobacillus deserti TaxID=2879466 RepID=UPI001D13E9AE|nr:hypothetical protein [Alkalihalobacillus deserti]